MENLHRSEIFCLQRELVIQPETNYHKKNLQLVFETGNYSSLRDLEKKIS